MSSNTAYSLLAKTENAHNNNVYCGVWAEMTVAGQKHNFIVTGGLDNDVKVWQWENGRLDHIHTLQGHQMGIVSLAVSPDGHTIASVCLDDTLIIWELLSGNKVHELHYSNMSFWAPTFSPDGEYLAVAGYTGQIAIIKVSKPDVIKKIDTKTNVNGKFVCIAWSPDGKRLAAGTVDGNILIYDMERECLKHTIQAHKELVRSVAFSANSTLLATASSDGLAKIYNMKNAALKGTLNHKSWVLSVCFSKDGMRLATADDTGAVRVARTRPQKMENEDVTSGRTTMTSISNSKVSTVEVATDKSGPESIDLEVLKIFKEHTKAAWTVQFSPDQTKLLSVSKDQSINIYEIPPLKKK